MLPAKENELVSHRQRQPDGNGYASVPDAGNAVRRTCIVAIPIIGVSIIAATDLIEIAVTSFFKWSANRFGDESRWNTNAAKQHPQGSNRKPIQNWSRDAGA